MDTATRIVLTPGDAIGLVITAEAGLISLTATLVTIVIVVVNIVRHKRRDPSWRIIEQPMEIYIVSLLFSGVLQSVGTIIDIHWIRKWETYTGAMCNAQGSLKQLGETTVAMTSLAIVVHAFVVIWWNKGADALFVAKCIIWLQWIYVGLFVAIGASVERRHDYYAPVPFWCWIGANFLLERIFGEYIWFWLALLFSVVLYIPLYFCSRGNITVNDQVWWKFSIHRSHHRDNIRLRSLGLIAYPLVDSILYLPLSVVRWIEFTQPSNGGTGRVPNEVTFFVITLHALSGAFNVLLLFTIRSDLLLFKRAGSYAASEGLAPPAIPLNEGLALPEIPPSTSQGTAPP